MGPIRHTPHHIDEDGPGRETTHVQTNDVVDIQSAIGDEWLYQEWDGGFAHIAVHVDMHWISPSAAGKTAVIALSATVNGKGKKLLTVRRAERLPQRLQFATMNVAEIWAFDFLSR